VNDLNKELSSIVSRFLWWWAALAATGAVLALAVLFGLAWLAVQVFGWVLS
jgi:hypothetical protein